MERFRRRKGVLYNMTSRLLACKAHFHDIKSNQDLGITE